MVAEGYSVDDAEAFCKKYNLTLRKNLVETNAYTAGRVISQSRIAGSEIVEGTNLTIEVAATPTKKEEPKEDPKEDPPTTNDDNTNTQ